MKTFEKELIKSGFQNIAGLDEAGRGPLAGPIVVAICVFANEYVNAEINDSKKLSATKREQLFEVIIRDAKYYDFQILDAEFVDKHNPKKSSIIGMENLIEKALSKGVIDFALIDAEKVNTTLKTKSIIKGDQLSQTIAAASIIAKQIRDKIMVDLSKEYPTYGFDKHKGYGTKMHLQAIKDYGPIVGIHRFSYKPIKTK